MVLNICETINEKSILYQPSKPSIPCTSPNQYCTNATSAQNNLQRACAGIISTTVQICSSYIFYLDGKDLLLIQEYYVMQLLGEMDYKYLMVTTIFVMPVIQMERVFLRLIEVKDTI